MLDIFQKAEVRLNSDPLEEEVSTTQTSNKPLLKHGTSGSIQLLGERALQKAMAKIRDWRKTIIASEKKKLRRSIIDL